MLFLELERRGSGPTVTHPGAGHRRCRPGSFWVEDIFTILICFSTPVRCNFFHTSDVQAKYAIPRSPGLVHAHRAQKLVRPRLKLHAVWSFAHALRICVLDETTFHGSSMVIQALAMTIEDSMRIAGSRGAKPDTLAVIGDNTVKELKNGFCLRYLLSLILHKRLKCLRCI